MKTISIKELHAATGKWVHAAKRETIAVTDHGELVAVLKSHSEEEKARPVFKPRLVQTTIQPRGLHEALPASARLGGAGNMDQRLE